MSLYYKHLNLNIPVINDSAPLNELKTQYQTDMDKSIEMYIHPSMIDLLKSKNVYISHIESFFLRPNINLPIHVDDGGGDYVKINYVIGGKDSLMHWYQINPGVHVKPKTTTINTQYFSFKKDQVELVDCTTIDPVSIVQVGIPHNITNTINHRLCISMCISHWHNQQRLTMSEAVDIFSEYILV
jgi:hypothetical protein